MTAPADRLRQFATLRYEITTILGAGLMAGAIVAWLLGRIPTSDFLSAAAVAGTWIGLRQVAPIPSRVPAPVIPIPAVSAADPARATGATETAP